MGDRGVRIARPRGSSRALVNAILAWPGVVDVIVTREDVAIFFAGPPPRALPALGDLPDDILAGRDHEIRVVYDGEDLDDVARATGLSRDEVIALHRAPTYVVGQMGFLPGFAYLDGLDPKLGIPRRATPRPRIPARALAIAAGQTAVYPFATPGGWHLIGRALDVVLFDERGPLLELGDRVRFVP